MKDTCVHLIDFANETEDDLDFLLSEADVVFRCFMDTVFLDQSSQNLSRLFFGTSDFHNNVVLNSADYFEAQVFMRRGKGGVWASSQSIQFFSRLTNTRKTFEKTAPCVIMIIGWRNQSNHRLISLSNGKFGSELIILSAQAAAEKRGSTALYTMSFARLWYNTIFLFYQQYRYHL